MIRPLPPTANKSPKQVAKHPWMSRQISYITSMTTTNTWTSTGQGLHLGNKDHGQQSSKRPDCRMLALMRPPAPGVRACASLTEYNAKPWRAQHATTKTQEMGANAPWRLEAAGATLTSPTSCGTVNWKLGRSSVEPPRSLLRVSPKELRNLNTSSKQ